LIFNPDTYWNDKYIDCIKNMENFYFKNNINNILLVVNKNLSFDKKLKGDFNLNKKIIDRKNSCDFIYTGCQILNKKIFSKVDESKFSINKLWTKLIEKKKLFGFESKNKFIHITDINIYNQLLKND
jgi:MurNAc alpha-1-phosphate uridylyltransferase